MIQGSRSNCASGCDGRGEGCKRRRAVRSDPPRGTVTPLVFCAGARPATNGSSFPHPIWRISRASQNASRSAPSGERRRRRRQPRVRVVYVPPFRFRCFAIVRPAASNCTRPATAAGRAVVRLKIADGDAWRLCG